MQMWISKTTSVIGDMTKEIYFSHPFNHCLSNTPRNPSSIPFKTIVVLL